MTKEQEMNYWAANPIIVQKQKISDNAKCPVRGCKKYQKYTLFVGACRLSNLYETSCEKHLAYQFDKTNDYRKKYVTELINLTKRRERQELEDFILDYSNLKK